MNESLSTSVLAASTSLPRAARDPELLQATGTVLLLALENAELEAVWRQSRRELADARARLIQASDRERRRLERDLHDGAQQRLTAIQLKLRRAQEKTDDAVLARQLELIGAEVELAVDELRSLARGIYPVVLRDCGLAQAFRSMATSAPVPIAVIDEGIGRCSPAIEAAVYFCALEAIQNAVKHAGAGARITVALRRDADELRFGVIDDGAGMDVPVDGDGIGLSNMRDRIVGIGGELEIVSSRGQGTVVRGSVPLTPGSDRPERRR